MVKGLEHGIHAKGEIGAADGNQKWVLSWRFWVISHYFQNVRGRGLKAVSSPEQRIVAL
ncbi:hypothetical protein HAX54_035603, partial [Datura stramonium]|nr:hypothetical protein [Datura stramonium]